MTYCLGLLLKAGLVMIADTRTNAGIDNISVYRKLHTLASAPDRLIFGCTSGNLSVSQSVVALLTEGLPALEDDAEPRTLATVPTMFRAAQLVGEAVLQTHRDLHPALDASGIPSAISMLIGGRIGKGPLKLYMIYDEGNFIECQPDSPFLQIGATQYGKPILDRAVDYDSSLDEAIKVGLLSFDSTIRSDLSVGLPLDLCIMGADPEASPIVRRIEADDPYFNDLSRRWSGLLKEARAAIPDPPFLDVSVQS
jgi:putative proteasome-type protease